METSTRTENGNISSTEGRRLDAYEAPRLVKHGSLRELTLEAVPPSGGGSPWCGGGGGGPW
jgi:hypothetical protein